MTAAAGLRITDLTVTYPGPRAAGLGGRRTPITAVNSVRLGVAPDETVALVGESGSGKSTIARAVVGLVAPSAGSVDFDGASLLKLRPRDQWARRNIAMIFQDPRSALNPRLSAAASISEAWEAHPDVAPEGVRDQRRRRAAVVDLLAQVGLDPDVAGKRPTALSGGQCQRVSIARALALSPKLLICDEAVSALDVSVQAQVLQLLVSVREARSLSMLFITHDLGVVRQVADRVAVMRRGELVESADVHTLFTAPQHDYTRELLSAAVDLDVRS
jgi:ABC-type glutathione transport system ATPase component